MTNDPNFDYHLHSIDWDALSHLEDLHDLSDARNVTFHFHFAEGNPYFSDRVLSKKFAVDLEEQLLAVNDSGLKLNPLLAEMNKTYDLNRQQKSIPVLIQWTSHEYNLVDKKPRMSIEEIEKEDFEVDYNDATGSFFNFFAFKEDLYELHSHLLELHSKALDLYAGVIEANYNSFAVSADEEDEEDNEDKEANSKDEEDNKGDNEYEADNNSNQVADLESDSNDNDEPKKKTLKV
ncbi:uncharacterized protein PGTG_06786 [Puccinia graminis f. sp. tritici CRL 75-36-700-3]|uniref:Uncharacterized protein n=1 Tax=Puccinia graminis f. sp. tritici (strain CRL 75-36-700-3 / race SCCL) TaxID=418459 RepID=E3K958_PUCGT|nr:uncharacterized protein PGTG_06786 [Puccinia graminis f. sp. tritici CRL 75-36-700-3]EFP80830.1 hypothetical protein PGTG_06786 [Puccinia graminis f. sp. tritici CRL 75-36-700-3]